MKFKPGESGNPLGRPKGSRNTQTQLIKLLEPHAEQLINKMVEQALEGDSNALRLCIERLLPKAKHNPIGSDLPTLEDNYMETIESILQEMLLGNITSDEGKKIIALIEEHQNRRRFDTLIHIP
ncbi:TPA: hypothetical protein I8Z04_001258 [Legionella pneumophila]|nr:hypothetical protein [Legionella pneumophila]